MDIKAFITHKDQEKYVDCQDRFSINVDTKSIALADGMSQSIFQKIWAQILVDSYTEKPQWEATIESVKELGPLWREQVMSIIPTLQPAAQRRSRNSVAKGMSAGATFVGIRFDDNKWEGWVLGDSCLIIVDKDNNIVQIETSQTGPFDSHPDYFDSNPLKGGKGQPKQISGEIHSDEKIILVSDPFSDFLYGRQGKDNSKELISELLSINSHKEFERLVDNWRDQGMHNDDSTLIIVECNDKNNFHILYRDDIDELIEAEVTTETSKSSICDKKTDDMQEGNVQKEKASEPEGNEECNTLKEYLSEIAESFIDSLPKEINKRKKNLKKQLRDKLHKAVDCYYNNVSK